MAPRRIIAGCREKTVHSHGPSLSEPHEPHILGEIYRLDERIGEGAMGSVYRALDMAHDRQVAIKLMKAEVMHADRSHRLFQREARAMASLHHTGLVHLFGYGFDPVGRPYLVMEWIDGFHLGKLRPYPSDLGIIVGIIDALLDALAHAHARGIVHRDLKPANIFVSGALSEGLPGAPLPPGLIKVGDFGIARIFERTAQAGHRHREESPPQGDRDAPVPRSFAALARRGFRAETHPYEVRVEGTPRYMAPEVYKGREGLISPANDIYAVGVLLYELLSGQKPFEADYEVQLIVRQFKGLTAPCPVRPELHVRRPPQMLLERMLAPEPFERIQSCAEVRHALRRWYSQERPGLTAVHLPWSGGAPWSRSKVSNRVEAARTQAEINLLPWRAAPLVGRDIEQVQLWRMFEEVGEDDAPQAVLVYGETGMGKTRLVSWLAESLVEVGQAHELRINLGPLTWEEGIRVALEREFHTTSLDDEAFGRRLRKAVALLEHQSTGRPMAGPEHGQQGVTETALYGQHLQAVAALLRPGVSLDDSEHSSRLEHYRSELIKRPNDLALRQRYAELLYGQGLKPEALSHYLNLAGAYRSRSMFFELNRVCRTILEIDPSNAKAQAYLNAVPAEVFQPNNVVHSEVRSATPRTPMPLALAESSGGGDPLADEGFVSSGSTMVTRMDSFARLSTLYGEHMGTLASILTRMSSSKPLVVVVDNVRASHWEEVISFLWTLHCMSLSRALPVLVVMTSLDRIPTLGWIPSTATVVSQLREGSKLQEMALSPLDEPAVEAIMDPYRTLGHDRRQRIQQVACGNPLFATSLANQMLMDALNPPDPHEEEDNVSVFEGSGRGVEQIEDLWLYRVHLLSRRSGLDTHAMLFLELLCCLDEPLEMALALRAWCAPEMRLIHRLASSRTAQVGEKAWHVWIDGGILIERDSAGRAVFAQGELKVRIRRDVVASKRALTYHSAAAWACMESGWPTTPRQGIELAGHLFGADLPGQAWRYALGAAQSYLEHSRYSDADTAYACCEAILSRQGVGRDDRRWDAVELGQARIASALGDVERARAKANALRRRGHKTGLAHQLAAGELILAELALHTHDLDRSEAHFDRALSRFQTCSDVRGQTEALLGLAQVAMQRSRLSVARGRLTHVQELLEELNRPVLLVSSTTLLLGQLEYRCGNLASARAHLHEACQAFDRLGGLSGLARARCALGYVETASDNFALAHHHHREALAQSEQIGDMLVLARARLGLAWVWMRRGQLSEAERALEQSGSVLKVLSDSTAVYFFYEVLSLIRSAKSGQWKGWPSRLERILEHVEHQPLCDPDLARGFQMLASTAECRQQCSPQLWRRLVDTIVHQWHNLGDMERATRAAEDFA